MESTVKPKVSVIMPVYNGELFIEQALDSLLAQSCQDWELIVVDDGSTDSTPLILNRYAVDSRIRVIRQNNAGEAGARNTGLDNMKGEYMAFLDADDIYLPSALSDLSDFLDSNPDYDVVFSDGYIFDQKDAILMRLTDVRPGIFIGDILDPLVMSPSVITVPTCTMSRSSKIKETNLHFDEKNNLIGTDWDFWIRLAVYVKFGYLDKLTCKYRIHSSNITRTYGSEKRLRDTKYRRMKILNSEWFDRLSLHTKNFFFLDLLTNVLSGDIESQKLVLQSEQFSELPESSRAELWRMAGINILQTSQDVEQAKPCFLKSRELNPHDRKTRFLLWSLSLGKKTTITLINFWRNLLRFGRKATSGNNSNVEHLQKLLGIE